VLGTIASIEETATDRDESVIEVTAFVRVGHRILSQGKTYALRKPFPWP
jgi:hypothetical protein